MAGFVAKKIFGEILENKFGTEDPYFENIPATRLDGTPSGKVKRVKKALPPGLSEHDAKVLTKMKRRAYRLDSGLGSCFGMRFGWESIIGIIPVLGDVIGFLLALMVIQTAKQVEGGLPVGLKLRMYVWAILDAGLGAIPVIGDLFDTALKANNRNTVLVENYLRQKGKKNLRQSGLPIPDVDPSDPDQFDQLESESRADYTSRQPSRHEPMSPASAHGGRTGRSSRATTGDTSPSQPAQARVRDDRRTGSGGGFLGSKRSRRADVEMGRADDGPARKPSRRG